MLSNTASAAKVFAQLDELENGSRNDDRSQLDQECAQNELAWLSESLDK